LVAAGCVRVPTDEEKSKIVTQLITATANGQTFLRWESRRDLEYTVLWANRFTASEWKPLENAIKLRGTGEPIEMRVPEDPSRPRTYKLLAVPLQAAGAKR
jgi:hypothetical protein